MVADAPAALSGWNQQLAVIKEFLHLAFAAAAASSAGPKVAAAITSAALRTACHEAGLTQGGPHSAEVLDRLHCIAPALQADLEGEPLTHAVRLRRNVAAHAPVLPGGTPVSAMSSAQLRSAQRGERSRRQHATGQAAQAPHIDCQGSTTVGVGTGVGGGLGKSSMEGSASDTDGCSGSTSAPSFNTGSGTLAGATQQTHSALEASSIEEYTRQPAGLNPGGSTSFPVVPPGRDSEQGARDTAGGELEARLRAFYTSVNPNALQFVSTHVASNNGDEATINTKLRARYGMDLTSMEALTVLPSNTVGISWHDVGSKTEPASDARPGEDVVNAEMRARHGQGLTGVAAWPSQTSTTACSVDKRRTKLASEARTCRAVATEWQAAGQRHQQRRQRRQPVA